MFAFVHWETICQYAQNQASNKPSNWKKVK